jgi:predicted Rossmann fold nucleotide-binding protein DprA/Smf involved in DNA uptake
MEPEASLPRVALSAREAVGAEQRNLLAEDWLTPTETKAYGLFSVEEPKPIDQLVETTGLNSSEVLATLFNLERKGILRQLPGKPFCQVLL